MENQPQKKEISYQNSAINAIVAYDNIPSKADEILSAQFYLSSKEKGFLPICQFIFLTLLRNKTLIEGILADFCKRAPRQKLYAAMRAAAAECLILGLSRAPKAVDSWVEYAKKNFSKGESAFMNAFLRKFLLEAEKVGNLPDTLENLSKKYSTPDWLVKQWVNQFGLDKAIEILKISQEPSEVFFRKSPAFEADKIFQEKKDVFEKTDFENFYILKSGEWDCVKNLLQTPYFYIQDPSTSIAAKLLQPQPNACYLDLCAAPGGKSRLIADLIFQSYSLSEDKNSSILNENDNKIATLVSVDFGKKRMKLLYENMSKINFLNCFLIECDLLNSDLSQALQDNHAPSLFDGVFLDSPCSNTGVLRRRPDARWRINQDDVLNCKKIQKNLLDKASEFVKIGGKLIFSTCSIDFRENDENVEEFLQTHKNFNLISGSTFPPQRHSDGCGAFAFIRSK